MGRPPGATNKTPRELRAEAKHLQKEAKLKERIQAKDKKIESLKNKSKGK